jgi:hypothetical protein
MSTLTILTDAELDVVTGASANNVAIIQASSTNVDALTAFQGVKQVAVTDVSVVQVTKIRSGFFI